MTDLKMFMALMMLTKSAAVELGLQSLSVSDKELLDYLWNYKNSEGEVFNVEYTDLTEFSSKGPEISRAQFFKSIKQLQRMGVLEHMGSSRSRQYRFIV